MKAVILAAGKSTRTYPLTITRPKPVLPLLDRPLLGHTLEALAPLANGAVIIVGYRGDMIMAAFGREYAGLPIEYVVQTEQLGTGDAVARARPVVTGDFLVVNGDDYYGPENVRALASTAGAAVLGAPVPSAEGFGVLDVDGDRLIGIREKPEGAGPALVNTGLYKVNEAVFDHIAALEPSPRGELEFTAALESYGRDAPVAAVVAPAPWLPVATGADLLRAQLDLWPAGEGRLTGEGCRLDPEAVVEGRSVLGAGCIVEAGAMVAEALLLERVEVDRGASVTGSVLGTGVTVGSDAMVDGAIVGDGARIAAGSRVEPGSLIWPAVRIKTGEVVAGVIK
ncbi:MAG: sugar phosphate nucleotidyltransferase [Candidatus Zixiibacteriota bacterium]|jgi:bifunctional UDP-N-acetylglucosamine pyrophosphorylase/glucosamine-1-phosphate N-acetyltransferase